ncbi:TetR/AcrR family transcriptional regulator [Rhodococcus rhodochrous]|uniref:TetR/AcrR family transcriptional regulator n=1 Tax=Rhodococcus rhodochrous TaxID=1829 RepID=UPI00188A329D|nr:TetR/AcrR family transcriptional regulator [Rhodococcus rhodochrous]MBF4479857.1 TetR/AcrR family transcriptional regulator [Rhodococcus rhodochrous]
MSTARPAARTRLLRAAEEMLFDRGIRATPVDDLLRRAEVSAASLYTHFGSKESLVAEALRVRLAEWRAVWDRHVVDADDDIGRLLAIFDALAAYRDDSESPARWCAFLATATEFAEPTDEIGEMLAADSDLLAERLLHLAKPVAGSNAQDLADDVLTAYNGTLASFLRGRPSSPIEVGRRVAHSAALTYQ